MKKIKVLEVIRQGQIGGGESHLIDLISGFGPEINPVVLAFTPGHMIDLLKERGITCYVVETSHAFDPSVIRQIRDIIRKEDIQLVHAHGSRAASNMILVSKTMKLPMIYTVHGWSFHQDQSFFVRKLRIISEKIICAMSRKIICVSESNRLTGQKAFGLHHATVIENGINLQKFNPENSFKNVRADFGIQPEDFVVGFIGRATAQKDPLTFVKSVESAHIRENRIKGLFIGDGDLKDSVMEYIASHQLDKIIYTSGFRTDIPDLLNAIDIFCLPSLWEGLSIALLEAMAMKCAVLVTPTDGTSEIIKDGVNGSLSEFRNPEMLTGKIMDYYSNTNQLRLHGENAMQLVRERFDSKNVSLSVAGLYQEILNKKAS